MDPNEVVLTPFVVVLYNLPVTVNETGRLVCSYSNMQLCEMFKDFSGSLKNTIKVGYNKDGVLLKNDKAFAYAEFREYYHALAVNEALKNKGRGRRAYNRLFTQGRGREEGDGIYGWLATQNDFDLISRSTKAFKKCGYISVGAILEEKQRQLERLDQEYEDSQQESEKLDADLKNRTIELESTLRELHGRKEDDAVAMSALELRREEMRRQNEENDRRNRAELGAAKKQIMILQSRVQQQEVSKIEKFEALKQLAAAKRKCELSKAEIEKFSKQCYMEDVEYKRLADLAQDEVKKREQVRQELNDLLETGREHRQKTRHLQMVDQLRLEGLEILDTECTVCAREFTRIPSYEEVLEQGISEEEFQKMNRISSDERCWRNRAIPCGHAKVCGECVIVLEEHAEQKSIPFCCPACRRKVDSYVVARINTSAV